ncbi:MAG TPA: UvrD-helicase domain-containing protein [Methanosarcina sp.]|jgi:superfamily I DNA/RNA helicase|nr:UvrD-helicase domain-containing protein [Methanosarcina sp.]
MIEISDMDIEYAEKIFLPEGCSFDLERRDVIKCMESKDIQACPGSGKTTTLLAKLAILAQKMPLEDNKGICVLTHTNVAINEIKGKLGKKGDVLFSYPNYFGTIQSFVDKYFAIPACIFYYNTRPSKIDSDSYEFEIVRKYWEIPKRRDLERWLLRKLPKREDITLSVYVQKIMFNYVDEIFVDYNGSTLLRDKNNEKYQQLFDIKKDLLKEGILHYEEAYSLAFKYLNDFGEMLKKTFSERFSFVFVDEMQDTNSNQNSILEQIFDFSNVIIQKFGDRNQAIYDGFLEKQNTLEINDCLCINGSKRFSSSIAQITQKLCVYEQNVVGNSLVQNIQPKFLVFDDKTINSVLPFFVKIIKEYNLYDEHGDFKAIGWIGKEKENKITLSSYYRNYQSKSRRRKIESNFLNEYLQKADDNIIKVEGVGYYRQLMINALLKVVKLLYVKDPNNSHRFTEKTLIQYLEKKDVNFEDMFNSKVADWCLKIHVGEDVSKPFKDFILNNFCRYFEDVDIRKLNNFFKNHDTDRMEQPQESNVYNKEDIRIEVATVHSVKGETHTATLYLETFHHEYDIETIIGYLRKSSGKPNKRQTKALKVAYVGMTRPTCLLCVAAHKDTISGNERYLQEAGWEIREVKNEN